MRPVIIVLLAISAVLVGCKSQSASAPAVRPAIVTQVEAVSATRAASYTGEIHAEFETQLGFRVAGKVQERLADVGDHVEAGQVLARLDATDLRLAAQAATSKLEAAREQYALAKRQYDRAHALHERNAISQSAYDQQKTALAVARAQLDQAQKQQTMQQNQLRYTRLHASHAGVITAVQAEPGQIVAAGQPVFSLARAGARELWIAVPEGRIDSIAVGDKVMISFWALPGVRVPGQVRKVAADVVSRTRTYPVRIALLKQPDALRLGMTATAHFQNPLDSRVIRLPLTSLYHADQAPAVWVVDPRTDKVALQPVKVLRYTDNAVVLATAQGLQAGALVVTRGVSKLHVGQQVKPVDDFLGDKSTPGENG